MPVNGEPDLHRQLLFGLWQQQLEEEVEMEVVNNETWGLYHKAG